MRYCMCSNAEKINTNVSDVIAPMNYAHAIWMAGTNHTQVAWSEKEVLEVSGM